MWMSDLDNDSSACFSASRHQHCLVQPFPLTNTICLAKHFSNGLNSNRDNCSHNCSQANIILCQTQSIQNVTVSNCLAQNQEIRKNWFWVGIIYQTVPPLKKKRGKNGKCIPKCWEFFGFWILNFVCISTICQNIPNLNNSQLLKIDTICMN